MKNNFEELYNGHCLRCGETFSECARRNCDKSMIPQPDWDAMKKEFDQRLESPYYYRIKHKDAKIFLAKNEKDFTIHNHLSLRFFGKDGKAIANLYLYLNQEQGFLKKFIVEEKKFR